MMLLLITSFASGFGASLFNIHAVWGDKAAKIIRNFFIGMSALTYIIFLSVAGLNSVAMRIMFIAFPIFGIGLFLAEPALLQSKKISPMSWWMIAIGGCVLVAGAIMSLFEKGGAL